MPDFSVILQAPEIRTIVQENMLERAFHDALFPRMLFRGEATPVPWPTGIGDTQIFTAPGLIPVNAQPLVPGSDPQPSSYPVEQWTAQLQQYANSIDTHMPTSIVAIANLFLRNSHQLGMQAAQTLNRITRNRMYGAGLSGWTVSTSASGASTTVNVARLNGLTRARRPDLPLGNPVRFDFVSSSNPLQITIFDNGAAAQNTIVGYTSLTPGDEFGPGSITLGTAPTNVATRAYIYSIDSTYIDRVGGGLQVDSLTASNIPTLADIRQIIAHLWQMNVPEHPDMRFHAHLDPISQSLVFQDNEFQRLLTALPDYYMYRQFALGELLNTVFFRNSECPVVSTVVGASATYVTTVPYNVADPFPGELVNPTNIPIHRILFTAQGGIFEYYSDLSQLITEAGIMGLVGDPRVVNNGIEINSDRIQLIIRGPLNRLQDKIAVSWKFIGDWPVRTDATTGDSARFKRFAVIEHGGSQ